MFCIMNELNGSRSRCFTQLLTPQEPISHYKTVNSYRSSSESICLMIVYLSKVCIKIILSVVR